MCMVFMPVIIFVLGLLIGSFLNVVIFRMNTGRSVVTGHSKCMHCSRELAWYELIPVFSFLALRGKCRTCNVGLSFQYPVVELTTALVFIIAYIKLVVEGGFGMYSWLSFIFATIISSLLIVITIYDLKHKIIPDTVVYPFILLSLVSIAWKAIMFSSFNPFMAIVDGLLVALPFFLLWYLSKGRLMGFGDVKLALGIGWLVGLSIGYGVFLIAFWTGGIVGLFLLATTRKYAMKSQVPFGPFLVVGLFIAAFWQVSISSLFPLWP